MIEKIDTNEIKGEWSYESEGGVGGGDQTEWSLKTLADKINEICEWINAHEKTTGCPCCGSVEPTHICGCGPEVFSQQK